MNILELLKEDLGDSARSLERKSKDCVSSREASFFANSAIEVRAQIAAIESLESEVAELRKDKARLDWLSAADCWFEIPATGSFTPEGIRIAIDAEMSKEAAP